MTRPLVLCWHKVERRRELGVTRVSPARFARQVEHFAREGWRSLSLEELLDRVAGDVRPSGREVVFTFDDAYRGLREHAFPVLRDHGFTSLCAVITDYAGRLNRWDVPLGGIRFAHLAWRDIEAWSTRGVSFVSHTATHPRLTWLADREVREELSRSRGALERALGGPCTAIAWPFGASGARERALAREEGYVAALGIGGRWRGDPFAIPRVPVYPWSGAAPGAGALAPLERALGTVASRCSVGTSVLRSFARAREG